MYFGFNRSYETTCDLGRLGCVDVETIVVAMRERDHGGQEDKALDLLLLTCSKQVRIHKHDRFVVSYDFRQHTDP